MILLTGATGFLGSRLLARLLESGHEVVVLKRSFSNIFRINDLIGHANVHLFDIDLHDPIVLFKKYPIDTIVHAATNYGRGETPIFKILEANLILPLCLAEMGLAHGVRCFINTDSYFNKSNNSYSNLFNYSASKKSILIWLNQLSGKIKVINVVLEHIYGPNDSPSKFVESLIQQIAIAKVERVALTHGHQKRDFVYLDDAVSAYIKLIEYGRDHEFNFKTFEVGMGESVQIRDFVAEIKENSNSPTILGFGDVPYRGDEIMDSFADISPLRELGWSPTVSIKDGVRNILNQLKQ